MKTKIVIGILLLIFFIGVVSASNLEDMNFNIPSGFEKVDDAVGLQYVDNSKNVRIRIFDDEMDKWDNGFEKYNETVLVSDETMKIGNQNTYALAYGEFIKIDGKEYWVEVSNEDIVERNEGNCLETLDYFNQHNSFDPVEV